LFSCLKKEKKKKERKENMPNRDDVTDRWVSEVSAALL